LLDAKQHLERKQEGTMASNHLPDDLVDLCQRAQRACTELAALRAQIYETRLQARLLIAQSRQTHPVDGWSAAGPATAAPLIISAFTDNDDDLAAAAKVAVRMMRTILVEFPPRWQTAMVKALGARAVLVEHEWRQARPVISA
jgi:hypothetical protein